MERESFENPEIAGLLNDTFVNIKVDREERPEIDAVYMKVCQVMTQSGGWPLTIMMSPDKQPFFAATYIPDVTRYGRVGLREMIPTINRRRSPASCLSVVVNQLRPDLWRIWRSAQISFASQFLFLVAILESNRVRAGFAHCGTHPAEYATRRNL